MAVRQYRCIVTALNIRTEPRSGDQYKTGETIRRHEIISADDATRLENEGFLWVRHARGWSAMRSLDGTSVFLTDAIGPRDRVWGINIDPNNPRANPPAERLTGLGWARFVLHGDSRNEPIQAALNFYDPIVRALHQNGTRVLLILLQDTFLGNRPWVNGDWPSYISGFASRAALIARRFRGYISAYQIWNEGDVSGAPTSHYIEPGIYASMLAQTTRAIRLADPTVQVITQGLASGVSNGIAYMSAVRSALGGVLPVDGVAVHPYGHVPPDPDAAPFPDWAGRSLDNLMRRFTDAFPGMPIWITEIGVPMVDVNDQSLWPRIGTYMDKTIDFLRSTYTLSVPCVTWFAWTDSMAQAGIVNDNGQAKGPIHTNFYANLHQDYPTVTRPASTPFDGRVMLAHRANEAVPDRSVGELAARVYNAAPNASGLIVRTSSGTMWLARGDGMGINGADDLPRWSSELARYRIGFHAWHELHGTNPSAEIALINLIGAAPGVRSLLLDLNAAVMVLRGAEEIRSYMISLRRAIAPGFPVGLSFDGRPAQFGRFNLAEWLPYIDSWHPRIFHLDYGLPIPTLLTDAFNALRPLRKPIVPILQLGTGVEARSGAALATETHNAPGVIFWRLTGGDITTIRGVSIPWLAGYVPVNSLGVVTSRGSTPLPVRVVPTPTGEVTSQIAPGTQVTVLERRSRTPFEWVRHSRGWTVARNTQTGEVFLS